MERIRQVQEYVDGVISKLPEEIDKKYGYMHLYGVSQACAFLAMKRKQNVELATIAGLLHDIYTYKNQDMTDHAHKGAELVKEILSSLNVFSNEEINMISQAIYHHSDKADVDSSFDEVLKDADVLQHCLYNPLADVAEHEKKRFEQLKRELEN